MKEKENRKEILTIKNIRRDLWRRLWTSWLLFIVCVAIIVWFIYEFHRYPQLLFERGTGRHSYMPGWAYLLLTPFLLYIVVKEAWVVACGFRRRPYVAKDTLISSEGDSYYATTRGSSSWCVLHFNGYGDYKVPVKNYPWSKENAMTPEGVYHTSFDGNEFYLVLSRPHNGKILLAYNTELFRLETEMAAEE